MSFLTLFDDNNQSYEVDNANPIASGGEGKIANIKKHPTKVAKLYLDRTREITVQRINELTPLPNKLFLKPLFRLKGGENGFVMDKLDGSKYYPLDSMFSSSFVIKRGLPSNYKEKISRTIIEGVNVAHTNNIVIGDLNPYNIMIDDQCDVKFIDVDSYETKSFKHNGKLLDSIRDHYFGGNVTKDSDYFALSTIIFNLLTGIHPYKGFHTIYGNNLKDRMINNISILSRENKNIKIPKFYEPLQDTNVIDMFKEIFDLNKRFLINMDGKTIGSVKFTGTIVSDKLLFTELFNSNKNDNEQLIEVTVSNSHLNIKTTLHNYLYYTPNKGIVVHENKIVPDINMVLTDNNAYGFKDGVLKLYNKVTKTFNEITNLKIYKHEIYLIKQYENILVVITKNDKLYKIYMDEIISSNVRYSVTEVYYESFHKNEGMYQNIGNRKMIFYNNGKDLTSVFLNENNIKDVIQKDNVGIATVNKNNKIEYQLFRIDKYAQIKTSVIPEKYPFTSNEKFIIIARDDKISFIDKETLQEVTSFEIDMNGSFNILSTNSGIILYDREKVLLVNSK
jgi:serine/threonine protein kinase